MKKRKCVNFCQVGVEIAIKEEEEITMNCMNEELKKL